MFEKFDFSWFLTIPGILTSIGCLLIIVAILIFISSLGKKKKDEGESLQTLSDSPITVSQTPVQTSVVDTAPATQTVGTVGFAADFPTATAAPASVAAAQPVSMEPQVVAPTPISVEPVQAMPQAPVSMEPQIVAPTPVSVEPVQAMPQAPVSMEPQIVAPTPVSVEPVQVMPQAPVSMEPQIVAPTPVGIAPVQQVVPPVNNMQQPTATNLPYGGVSPAVPTPIVEAPHQIYGGANPLDGTGIVPNLNQPIRSEDIESL